MNVELAHADAADRLLANDGFTARWTALYEQCPWATGFQSPAFARAWLSTFRPQFEPVFAMQREADGTLRGLMPLARRSGGAAEIIPLGGLQAEYQGWICTPDLGNEFPWRALEFVRRQVSSRKIAFRYVPAGTPLEWVMQTPARQRCVLVPRQRPVQRLGDGSDVAASLRKSGNKSRLRQLKKLGEFSFTRIDSFEAFECIIDDILRFYDFRHGAVHGSAPVSSSETHRDFHLSLMRSGLLHVTAMRCAERLVAAHWGVRSRDELELGTIVHDPSLARSSPGKLHLLMLAQMLVGEGCQTLDLTPGDDPYKERFATDWDTVHTLDVLPSTVARTFVAIKTSCARPAKAMLRRLGRRPAQVQTRLQALRQRPIRGVLSAGKRAAHWLAGQRTIRLITVDRETILRHIQATNVSLPSSADTERVIPHLDRLDDLLSYRPAGGGTPRQAFLSDALARFEDSQQAYSLMRQGRLAWLGWLADSESERLLDEPVDGFGIGPSTAVLCDLHKWPDATDRDVDVKSVVAAMLADALARPGIDRVVAVLAGGSPVFDLLRDEWNFAKAGNLVRKTRLGRRRWHVNVAGDLLESGSPPVPTMTSPDVELTAAAAAPKKPKASRERDLTPAG